MASWHGRIRISWARIGQTLTGARAAARFGITIRLGLTLGMTLAAMLAGCGPVLRNGTPLSTILAQEGKQSSDAYRLQPGDQVDVTHILDPDYNAVTVVAPDGRISVPGIDQPVRARGLTVAELGQELDRSFQQSHVLNHPFFSINLRGFGSLQVFVGGEVQRPGYLDLSGGPRNVLQIVMAAGGFLPTARRDEVLVLRPRPDGQQEIFAVNIDKVLSGTDLTQNVPIHPLDTIVVPRSDIASLDVWVDQYIRQALPIPVSGSLTYTNNPSTSILK
jgi:protein involved in polysaccharide export with SLBB domain